MYLTLWSAQSRTLFLSFEFALCCAVMAKYKLKFLFDWGSGVCLWSANQETEEMFGDYPVDSSKLHISSELMKSIDHLIDIHDDALDWDDPGGELLWTDEKIEQFLSEAKLIYERLCNELGSEYDVKQF